MKGAELMDVRNRRLAETDGRIDVPRPTAGNQHWGMDFVHDQLANGRTFRVLTVIDQWSRESVVLEVDFALNGQRVADALKRVAKDRPLPRAITVDHDTEFTSKVSTNGPIGAAWSSTSSGLEDPSRTHLSSPSTGACATNV